MIKVHICFLDKFLVDIWELEKVFNLLDINYERFCRYGILSCNVAGIHIIPMIENYPNVKSVEIDSSKTTC